MLKVLNRTETISFRDFMDGSYKQKERRSKKERIEDIISYSLLGLSAVCAVFDPMGGSVTLAASLQERIIHAFDPLIQLLQGISYPVAFLMITAGFLLIMTGQKSRGISMMKYAGLGYIGLQLAPALMGILVEIGKEMSKQ
jgi:Type IV secretion system pilin